MGFVNTFAQKLPIIQKTSLRLTNVKIDGHSSELNGQFQAYNKATEIFYSVGNDKENLYLIIHAAESRIIEKILEGGISFTINPKRNNQAEVLFPLLTLPDGWKILRDAGKTLSEAPSVTPSIVPGKDSIMAAATRLSIPAANKRLATALKEIKIAGMKEITDTIPDISDITSYYRNLPLRKHDYKWIAIYNNYGIMANVQFDDNAELTYELASPIKYLQLGDTDKIKYNIKIHGRGEDGRPGNTVAYSPPPNQTIINQDLENSTDFDGEYILAK